jgi:hypothetical protein
MSAAFPVFAGAAGAADREPEADFFTTATESLGAGLTSMVGGGAGSLVVAGGGVAVGGIWITTGCGAG